MGANPMETMRFNVPEPRDTEEKPAKGGTQSPAERMRKAYYEGVEIEAFKKGAGLTEPKAPAQNTEMQQLMVATMQSYSNALTSLISELVKAQGLSAKTNQPDSNEFFKYLITEVKDMKQRMEGGQGNPFELIDEYHTRMTKWQDDMQKRVGSQQSSSVQAAAGLEGMKLTLEVERMRMEAADRQRQHEEKMSEMKRNWEREDRRWEQEFILKKEEAKASQERTDTTLTTLKTLAVSLVDSIDTTTGLKERAYQPPAPHEAPSQAPKQELQANQFACEKCGATVTAPEGAASVVCPNEACKMEYKEG